MCMYVCVCVCVCVCVYGCVCVCEYLYALLCLITKRANQTGLETRYVLCRLKIKRTLHTHKKLKIRIIKN